MKTLPTINFIGIGTQKSGTSWLFRNLKKLPDFSLLPIKELRYFDRHPKYPSRKGLFDDFILKRVTNPDWLFGFRVYFLRKFSKENFKTIKWKLKYFFSKANDDLYLSFFENLEGLKGEVTPSYSILEKEDIQKMYRLAPEAKLILLLRNPIHRAWSQYLHDRRKIKGYLTKKIESEEVIRYLNSEKQTLRSDYERTIENYLSVYPKSQMLIGFFDAIAEQPEELMHSVVEFIGGDTEHISKCLDLKQKFNVNKKVEMPDEVFEFLKSKYKALIERLALEYGGYFSVWLEEVYGVKNSNNEPNRATIRF
jgi:ABC-type multidrug transport system fused ATPase/permease subunit